VALGSEINGEIPIETGRTRSGSAGRNAGMYRNAARAQFDDFAFRNRPQAEDVKMDSDRARQRDLTRAALEQTIENEAIPRLLKARKDLEHPSVQSWDEESTIDPKVIEILVRLIRTKDISAALSFLEEVQQNGIAIETIWLDVLGPCAARFGEMWEMDEMDFVEVTLCTWRLHEILRSTTALGVDIMETRAPKLRILMATLPNEHHSFGLAVTEAMFRRNGWHVWSWPGASTLELARLVKNEWFAIIGLSLSATDRLTELGSTIHALRKASQNRAVNVVVGGPIFVKNPEYAAQVGANAAAINGRHAIHQAHNLLVRQP
jgi:methanogenic corrinoid protein MtbC1